MLLKLWENEASKTREKAWVDVSLEDNPNFNKGSSEDKNRGNNFEEVLRNSLRQVKDELLNTVSQKISELNIKGHDEPQRLGVWCTNYRGSGHIANNCPYQQQLYPPPSIPPPLPMNMPLTSKFCEICKRSNHNSTECYYNKNGQGGKLRNPLVANVNPEYNHGQNYPHVVLPTPAFYNGSSIQNMNYTPPYNGLPYYPLYLTHSQPQMPISYGQPQSSQEHYRKNYNNGNNSNKRSYPVKNNIQCY
ncbi:hypothetical protein O6H91_Y503600 [Diphasiastrum complanatum]|nr:hypothetical protein O6H91_Y503600 [Diphasiastrum complanatum]